MQSLTHPVDLRGRPDQPARQGGVCHHGDGVPVHAHRAGRPEDGGRVVGGQVLQVGGGGGWGGRSGKGDDCTSQWRLIAQKTL